MTVDQHFREILASDHVVLIVRCGGRSGKCGRIRAVVLDDHSVRYSTANCHRFDRYLQDRVDVRLALREAARAKAYARRSCRPFKTPTIVIRPLLHHLREDKQLLAEREWEAFMNSDIVDDVPEYEPLDDGGLFDEDGW